MKNVKGLDKDKQKPNLDLKEEIVLQDKKNPTTETKPVRGTEVKASTKIDKAEVNDKKDTTIDKPKEEETKTNDNLNENELKTSKNSSKPNNKPKPVTSLPESEMLSTELIITPKV